MLWKRNEVTWKQQRCFRTTFHVAEKNQQIDYNQYQDQQKQSRNWKTNSR